jgi:hypothetical protein
VPAGVGEQTVVPGQPQMQFVRLAHRRLIVNPGSVQMRYRRGSAHWAQLGPSLELQQTPYQPPAAAEVPATGGYPDIEAWLDFFLRQTAGDAEALEVLRPSDGRRADR